MAKHIVITGGNQGIGYHMAEEFLREGNEVAILDLETDRLAELQKKYKGQLLFFVCDVRDGGQVTRCVNEVASKFHNIDIAIHNACLCSFDAMEDTGEETYRKVLDVNYFGALHLAKSVIPYMEKEGGRVVFTSSGVGVTGFYSISPYASSKGAIESLAKCMEIEYGERGISFHLFHPPLTRTKSAEPLSVPVEFLADPRQVGAGLAKRVNKKKFVICHSRSQQLQVRLCYWFPLQMGRMLSKLAQRAQKQLEA